MNYIQDQTGHLEKKKEEKNPSAASLVRTTATRGSILGFGFTLEIFLDTFQCQALFC